MNKLNYLQKKEIACTIKNNYPRGIKNKHIAISLNNQGLPTPTGKKWTASNVSKYARSVLNLEKKRDRATGLTYKSNQCGGEQVKKEILPEIQTENGRLLTTSLNISEVFGKQHKHVIEKIENLECSEDFRRSNFRPSFYTNSQNKEQPMYLITEKGFSFVVMGFNGKKAAKFKEDFINEFERMRETLNRQPAHEPLTETEILKKAFLIATEQTKKLEAKTIEQERVIEKMQPMAAWGSKTLEVITIPLSHLGQMLGSKVKDMGKKKIFKFLKDMGYLYQESSGRYSPYAQFSKVGKTQYFTIDLTSYSVPIKNLQGETISSKQVDTTKIMVTNSGAVKILEELYKEKYLSSEKEFINIHSELPKWFTDYRKAS